MSTAKAQIIYQISTFYPADAKTADFILPYYFLTFFKLGLDKAIFL